MKSFVLTITVITLLVFTVNAQEDKTGKAPDEEIIVNREYDEDGNLIGYDSTYIHRWSSDSTFSFDIPDDFFAGNHFPDIERLMDEFFNDSAFHTYSMPILPDFPLHGKEDFLKHFSQIYPDSATIDGFGSGADKFYFDHDAILKDMEKFQEQMQEHFGKFNFAPPSSNWQLNEDQKRELEELKKRHRKEIKVLQKKWKEEKQE